MGKRSVNLVRDVSKVLLDAAVRADDLVSGLAPSGIYGVFRGPRIEEKPTSDAPPASAEFPRSPPETSGKEAWDMRSMPPPTPSMPPPANVVSLPPPPLVDPPTARGSQTPTGASAFPSPLGVLRNTFDPRIPGRTKRQYRGARPWVQPSPHIPDGLAQTVLNVPDEEVSEFMDVVVGRYIRTLHRYWIKAAAYALRHSGAKEVTNAEFARLLADGPASRFLCPTLDPTDHEAFAGVLDPAKLAAGSYVKVDFSNTAKMNPRPGIYVADTVTLLERVGNTFEPVAIRINGLTVQPKHTNAYELAKYFVLQGGATALVLGLHPNVHFPMDAINAITRTILPEDHVVRQLLEPHFYMQLPLNYAVLYINKSLLKNDQREIYTPFVGKIEDLLQFMADYHRGEPGNSARPGYSYALEPPHTPSSYGAFLKRYFDVILEFTTRIAASVPAGDPDVRLWSQHISDVVHGFPGPDKIFEGDTLARALAFFIWDVAVLHTADHRAYGEISVNQMPWRLRVPPPTSLDMPPVDRARLVKKEDIFRHRMARVMYFKPTVIRRLLDADYPFDDKSLRQAAKDFMKRLRLVGADPEMRRWCPVEELAISIQF